MPIGSASLSATPESIPFSLSKGISKDPVAHMEIVARRREPLHMSVYRALDKVHSLVV
jgi:hypothetical protein